MANKRKWSAQETIKFLEGYESYPCLWDVHSTIYKNRDSRENAYQKLCELMNIEGFGIVEVKAKIRSIRNAYALELIKIKKSQHSGAGADEVYKPKVSWFSVADRILKQVVQIRETQSSELGIELQSDLDESVENTQTLTIEEVLSPSSNESRVGRKPVPQKLTTKITAPKRIRKRTSSTEKALQGLQEIAQKLDEKPNREDPEFDCFGKTVTSSLKKLPESVALESMAYIQSYLVRQRLANTQHIQQIPTNTGYDTSSGSCHSYHDDNSEQEHSQEVNASNQTRNLSYYNNNTVLNLRFNSQQNQSDLLTEAIRSSLYEDI